MGVPYTLQKSPKPESVKEVESWVSRILKKADVKVETLLFYFDDPLWVLRYELNVRNPQVCFALEQQVDEKYGLSRLLVVFSVGS